jgi:GNAT superfamily N-acetyltransferase
VPVIRPRVHDAKLSQDALLDYMRHTNYPYLEAHERIIDYAFVFTCEVKDKIAGFIWCYALDEDETTWAVHAMVLPDYQKRFFSRRLVNTLLGVAWVSGVDRVLVENSQTEMLLRVGGYMTDDGAMLDLPHKWG